MNNEEVKQPKYEIVVTEETADKSPIHQQVAKTMEVTEKFTVYEAMSYLGKLKKALADKEAEIKGIESMIEAYETELEIIEGQLGIQKMEEDYQKEFAENISKETEAEVTEA
jgi:hypothetical protein